MPVAPEGSAPEFEELPAAKVACIRQYRRLHVIRNMDNFLPGADAIEPGTCVAPEAGVPVIVATVTRGGGMDVSVEGAGASEGEAVDEEEPAGPDEPPAAADNWAKPTDGGLERNTV
jgi:hypothetical protein